MSEILESTQALIVFVVIIAAMFGALGLRVGRERGWNEGHRAGVARTRMAIQSATKLAKLQGIAEGRLQAYNDMVRGGEEIVAVPDSDVENVDVTDETLDRLYRELVTNRQKENDNG